MNNGATMIPSFCPNDAPPGEKTIFNLLSNDENARGWIVLHSLDIAQHVKQSQGEADIVILAPKYGILVLEVKSHNRIKYDENGWWFGRSRRADTRGPFKQASSAMHSLRKHLEKSYDGPTVPMAFAVAFPQADFNVSSPEWHQWQVLDRQSINSRSIALSISDTLSKAIQHYASKGFRWSSTPENVTSEIILKVSKCLRARFDCIADPAATLQNLSDNLKQCTEQQFRLLDKLADNERILIRGLAGTGKSTLAIEAARRAVSASEHLRIGLFCFNRLFGKKLKSDCDAIQGRIRSGSIHQWMVEVLSLDKLVLNNSNNKFWEKDLPAQILEVLETMVVDDEGLVDLLILDEAQDLCKPAYLKIFDKILKGGLTRGKWLIFGDFERQSIFANGLPFIKSFSEFAPKGSYSNFLLDENCRNTQEISRTLTLLARLDPTYTKTLREDTRNDPRILFYKSEDEQKAAVLAEIDQLASEGFTDNSISLLSPKKAGSLGSKLGDRFLELSSNRSVRDGIRYTTVHAFKGLESRAIILTDIEQLNTQQRLDIFYIGMSRALDRLVLLCHSDIRNELKDIIA